MSGNDIFEALKNQVDDSLRAEQLLEQRMGGEFEEEETEEQPEEDNDSNQETEREGPETEDGAAESEDDKDEDEDEGKADDADDEGEEAHIELSELAQVLGIEDDLLDVNDDGRVVVKTKVDGAEGIANLADLVKSYQLEGHLNKQNMEVVELKKALKTKEQELEQQANERLTVLEDSLRVLQDEMLAEYRKVDWDDLRANEPAEYAAQLADYQRRQATIRGHYDRLQRERQQQATREEQSFHARLNEEHQKLLTAIPEWKDEKVAKEEDRKLMEYGQSVGYTPEEMSQVADHRAVVILRKAMLYDQLEAGKPAVSKKVRKVAKVAKPGQPKDTSTDSAKLKQAKARARKSGSVDDIAAYLLQTGRGEI